MSNEAISIAYDGSLGSFHELTSSLRSLLLDMFNSPFGLGQIPVLNIIVMHGRLGGS